MFQIRIGAYAVARRVIEGIVPQKGSGNPYRAGTSTILRKSSNASPEKALPGLNVIF